MDITDVATQSAQTTVMANIQMQEIVLRLHAHKPSHLNDYTNSMVGAHPCICGLRSGDPPNCQFHAVSQLFTFTLIIMTSTIVRGFNQISSLTQIHH